MFRNNGLPKNHFYYTPPSLGPSFSSTTEWVVKGLVTVLGLGVCHYTSQIRCSGGWLSNEDGLAVSIVGYVDSRNIAMIS